MLIHFTWHYLTCVDCYFIQKHGIKLSPDHNTQEKFPDGCGEHDITTLVIENTITIKATINKELNPMVAIPCDSIFEGDVNVLLVSSERQT